MGTTHVQNNTGRKLHLKRLPNVRGDGALSPPQTHTKTKMKKKIQKEDVRVLLTGCTVPYVTAVVGKQVASFVQWTGIVRT